MEQKIKNILVPTDFSETGNNALITAVALCKQHKAVLHLMHVVENQYLISVAEPGVSAEAVNENGQEAREKLYNIYEALLRDYQIPVQMHMSLGIPYDEICKTASEIPIDMIVIGSHGKYGVREFFIGTTAFNVIKHTIKQVLTVPFNFKSGRITSVLFPVRSGNGVIEKFKFVQPLLKRGIAIHIALLCKDEESGQLLDYKEIKDILSSLKHNGIYSSSKIYICQNPAAKVLELSSSLKIDLLVINATLDYKWTQCFVGPYTQQIVNHAKVPVLSFHNMENMGNVDNRQDGEKSNRSLFI